MSTHPAAPTVRSADGAHAAIERMTEEVLKTAQGIGDLGMLTVAAAFFVVLSGAMMLGNWIAMKYIKTIKRKIYRRIVALVMTACSIWLFLSV